MPFIYYDDRITTRRAIPGFGNPRYDVLRDALNNTGRQQLIPFLGAGASMVPGTHAPQPFPPPNDIDIDIDGLAADLGLKQNLSKDFLKIALMFAQRLDHQQQAQPAAVDSQHAPSAWALANILAEMLGLDPFRPYAATLREKSGSNACTEDESLAIVKAVAELLNIHHSIPQLLTMGSFFTQNNRNQLREKLQEIFAKVKTYTTIQEAVVGKAQRYVASRNAPANAEETQYDKTDYLIITTNYDRLIEILLEERGVPYCVLTVAFDSKVYLEFSPDLKADPKFEELKKEYVGLLSAKGFHAVRKSRSLAMVYKMHGCPRLDIELNVNNIVIGDSDYVQFIRSNEGMIPPYIGSRMMQSRLLFLGYSFSDWNVRDLYEQSTKRRAVTNGPIARLAGPTDYVILRSYSNTDKLFFDRWPSGLSIWITDLSILAQEIS
jgi:SIR2-like domain